MRNNWFYSICLGALLILLASCSKEKDVRTAIPADVAAVYTADLTALAMNSGLDGKDVQSLMDTWMQKKVSDREREFVEGLMEEPSDAGIDFKQRVYLFQTAKNDFALLVKLDSKRKFKKLLAYMGEPWMNTDEWQSEDDFEYLEHDNAAIVLNDEMGILASSTSGATAEAMRLRAMGWLQQKEADSFKANRDSRVLEEKGGDIAVWLTLKAIPSQMYQFVSQASLPRDVKVEDIHYMANCYFEKGKLRLNATMLPGSEAAARYYETQTELMKPLKGEFLPDRDYAPWIWMALGIDGDKYYQLLEQNVEMKQLLEEAAFGFNIKKLVSTIDGDVAFTFDIPAEQDSAMLPTFAVQAVVKNDSIMEDMNEMQQIMGLFGVEMKKSEQGMYCLAQPDFKMWIGVDADNHFFCGNAENMLHSSQNHPEWTSEIKGCILYMRMDIRQQMEKKRNVLESDTYVRASIPVLELFDVMVLQSKNAKECNVELRAVDTQENVLKQVLVTLAEVYGKN